MAEENKVEAWYQEAVIHGVPVSVMPHKTTAAYRWKTFIRPLLPDARGVALDLGCNAGFYCREMKDLGFSPVGMDHDIGNALEWESAHPKDIRYLRGDICEWDFPFGVLALAACVLYWQRQHEMEKLVARLRKRVTKVIVMNRWNNHRDHKSRGDLENMDTVFRLWKRGEVIRRGVHYSVAYSNPKIKMLPTKKVDLMLIRSTTFRGEFSKVVGRLASGLPAEDENTSPYYQYLSKAGAGYRYENSVNLVKSVLKDGIKEPIKICNGRVIDGSHRVIIAKKLNIPYLLCEDLCVA